MSFTLVARLWEYKFTASERAILGAMVDHADEAGGSIRPSIARVAWKTDYSERQVQRCVHALTDRGVLVIVRPAAGRRPTEYRLDLTAAERKPAFNPRGDVVSLRQDDTPDNVSPLRARSSDTTSPLANPEPIRGDIDAAVGVTFATVRGDMVTPEPTKEPTNKNKPKRDTPPTPSPGAAGLPQIHLDRFERFYRSYPKHRARGAALKWWTRNKPDEALLLAMLSAVDRARASPDWQKQKGRFVPQPATWLNNLGWLDEMETSTDERSDEPISSNGHGRFTAFVSNGTASGSRSGIQSQS